MTRCPVNHAALDAWIDAHFDEQVRFLQTLVRVPTDTPPGDNARHAEVTAAALEAVARPPRGTVEGEMAHAAIHDTGTDALQGAVHILQTLYRLNAEYLAVRSGVEGITHPYLNIGRIEGGTNTNVVPGKVVFKLDRRMIPEEDPAEVEAALRRTIVQAASDFAPPRGGRALAVTVRRLLLARAMRPLPGARPLVQALQRHAQAVLGEAIPAVGTPLYTDVRLYVERGIPGVIYGAGPRTVRESNAKRADEHLVLEDLRRATRVVARALADLLEG